MARSALSMTLLEIEGHRVGAHPLESGLSCYERYFSQETTTGLFNSNMVSE